MLTYAETACRSSDLPVVSASQSQCQQDTTHPLSSVSSYRIGPIDPAQLIAMHAHLSDGEECSLLVPVHLPSSVLTHPIFKEGCEWGYTFGAPEAEEWTVPKLVNEVYQLLAELCYEDEPDFCPWTLGFVLGELASLAEQDRALALTGLAHYCALLSFFSLDAPLPWPPYRLLRAHYLHNDALRTYRGRVRACREQGKSFAEAQRLALCE